MLYEFAAFRHVAKFAAVMVAGAMVCGANACGCASTAMPARDALPPVEFQTGQSLYRLSHEVVQIDVKLRGPTGKIERITLDDAAVDVKFTCQNEKNDADSFCDIHVPIALDGQLHFLQVHTARKVQKIPLAIADLQPIRPDTNRDRFKVLVIGNENYDHLPAVAGAQVDALAMKNALAHETSWHVLPEHLKVKVDLAETEFIGSISRFFTKAAEGDVLLFYYAGHGATKNEYGYLLPTDFAPSDRHGVVQGLSHRALWHYMWKAVHERHVERIIAIIDACYSGMFTHSKDLADDTRIAMLTSTSDVEATHSSDNGSIFTQTFAGALRDSNALDLGRGAVTVSTAFERAAHAVLSRSAKARPHRQNDGMVYDTELGWPTDHEKIVTDKSPSDWSDASVTNRSANGSFTDVGMRYQFSQKRSVNLEMGDAPAVINGGNLKLQLRLIFKLDPAKVTAVPQIVFKTIIPRLPEAFAATFGPYNPTNCAPYHNKQAWTNGDDVQCALEIELPSPLPPRPMGMTVTLDACQKKATDERCQFGNETSLFIEI